MTFSEKIKELRKEKGISQEIASSDMGMAISSLRNYENGRLPDTEQLRKIQQYYDVPYEYLLNDDCTTKNYNHIEISKELGLSDNSIKTLKHFKNIADTATETYESFNNTTQINSISTCSIINMLLEDKSFFETFSEYIMLEIINEEEIKEMKEDLNISNELYEYTRLSKILNRVLELKNSLLKDFYHK